MHILVNAKRKALAILKAVLILFKGFGKLPTSFFAIVCADVFQRKSDSVKTIAMLAVNEVAESITRKKSDDVATTAMLALNFAKRSELEHFFKDFIFKAASSFENSEF